ncbi:conserved hypothetical protein [Uncinocarpus reesii 1704]|uniref:Transmembrane protein 135 N-terminal domain-containing protein n=1 Tax=Uncinocarpus reesii (strain UAMH 1704) TaxID=336963 RepID=C4JJ03_UNCRE|nr:uncharacterized protein UREG_01610 [Uncinocarpus reesii 1704]EEP76761.1 conserved hypothetical protein [Uncinocarpus reesii 1704]
MASHATPEPASSASSTELSPILSRALLICLSPREYKGIHDRLAKRLPSKLRDRPISPDTLSAIADSRDQFTTEALRSSLRAFLATEAIGNVVETAQKLFMKNHPTTPQRIIFRFAISHSLFILAHRLLYRFFTRLRANLRTEDARPFRKRNPRIAKILISKYTPAIGASLACFALGLYPSSQPRITLAIFMAAKSLEFAYNALWEKGWFQNKPWWIGSWLLMPLSCAQLFHAFVFDRETIPKWLSNFIVKFSLGYMQIRPEGFPTELHWPDQYESVDALAKISELKWPAFISPILHPHNPNPLPAVLEGISPIASPAHPAMASLSCALLHPKTPSCLTAFLQQNLLSIPLLARTISKIAVILSLPGFASFLLRPVTCTNALCRTILSSTAVLSAALGAAWGSICLFNSLLPRSMLRTQRFYLSGALAGAPFMFFRAAGVRSHFIYFFRLAVDSAWKAGVKRGLWRGWTGGELWILAVSWAAIGAILESNPKAVTGSKTRKILAWIRGDGFMDPAESRLKKKGKKAAAE